MTNILSTLRGSGIFCGKLVRNTSKLLSRILNFYNSNAVDVDGDSDPVDEGFGVDDVADDPPPTTDSFRWPSNNSGFVPPEPPSRSDSCCSCFSCALPSRATDRQRRPSRLVEGVSAEKFYKFGELLGEGTFSRVYLAEPLLVPGGLVAVKVIDKSSLIRKKTPDAPAPGVDSGIPEDPESVEYEDLRWLIDREIQVMSALEHPHIIHLEEVYEDDDRVYFILELAKVIMTQFFFQLRQLSCYYRIYSNHYLWLYFH